MKKILSVILILTLLTLCSCKRQADDETASVYVEKQASDTADNAASPDAEKADTEADVKSEETDTAETVEPAVDGTEVEVETKADQNDTEQSKQTYTDRYVGLPSLKMAAGQSAEIFIGEILSASTPTEFVEFEGFSADEETNLVLYTVKIKQVFKSQVTAADTTVRVVHATVEDEHWVGGYEVGKDYLIGGRAHPYSEKPVILDYSQFTALVNEDGTLAPQSFSAELVLEGISDVMELLGHPDTVTGLSRTDIELAEGFYDVIPAQTDETAQVDGVQTSVPTDEQIIEVLKEAIKVDSDVVITPVTDGAVTE